MSKKYAVWVGVGVSPPMFPTEEERKRDWTDWWYPNKCYE